METNTAPAATETVTTVQSFDSATIHLGERLQVRGMTVVSACNGRAMDGYTAERLAVEVTCKRCAKKITL